MGQWVTWARGDVGSVDPIDGHPLGRGVDLFQGSFQNSSPLKIITYQNSSSCKVRSRILPLKTLLITTVFLLRSVPEILPLKTLLIRTVFFFRGSFQNSVV